MLQTCHILNLLASDRFLQQLEYHHIAKKNKTIEAFEEIYQVVIDGISYNITSLFQFGKDGSINTTYTSTMGYYVIKFVSEAHTYKMTLNMTDK